MKAGHRLMIKALLLLMTGCDQPADHADLHHFMAIALAEDQPIAVMAAPIFEYRYQAAAMRNPFELSDELMAMAWQPTGQIKPYSKLSGLPLIGKLVRGDQQWLLLADETGYLHLVLHQYPEAELDQGLGCLAGQVQVLSDHPWQGKISVEPPSCIQSE